MIRNVYHSFYHHQQHRVIDRQVLAALAQILAQVRHQRVHDSGAMVVFYQVLVLCEMHFGDQAHHR